MKRFPRNCERIRTLEKLPGHFTKERLECICSEKNPKCHNCGVKSECLYAQGRVETTFGFSE